MSWSLYHADTGVFTGRQYSGQSLEAHLQVHPGLAAWAGDVNPNCWRVDVAAAEPRLVAWRPPQPPATALQEWHWSDEECRWLPQPTLAAIEQAARQERTDRLSACDWVALRAYERGQPMPAAWQAYRQALRDAPSQPGWPQHITWPQAPA